MSDVSVCVTELCLTHYCDERRAWARLVCNAQRYGAGNVQVKSVGGGVTDGGDGGRFMRQRARGARTATTRHHERRTARPTTTFRLIRPYTPTDHTQYSSSSAVVCQVRV